MKSRILFILILGASVCDVLADEGLAGKVWVTAFRSESTGVEQEAILFDATETTRTVNSNFRQSRGPQAVLGLFRAKTPRLMEPLRQLALTIQARLELTGKKNHGAAPDPTEHHRIHYEVNGHELHTGAVFRDSLIDLLERARFADWEAIDAVNVHWDLKDHITLRYSGKKTGEEIYTLNSLGCHERGQGQVKCTIPAYGTVLLESF